MLQLSHLEAGQNRADGKIDRLIYFIVGGLAVEGGLDFYSLKDAQREFGQKVAKELRQEASYAAKKSQEEFEQRAVSFAKDPEQKASSVGKK